MGAAGDRLSKLAVGGLRCVEGQMRFSVIFTHVEDERETQKSFLFSLSLPLETLFSQNGVVPPVFSSTFSFFFNPPLSLSIYLCIYISLSRDHHLHSQISEAFME